MENTQEQHPKQNYDWLKEYQWQKGQSGNPGGRPKGKSLKTFTREFLESMSEEGRIEFLKTIDPEKVWRMAEGNPKQDTDITSDGKAIPQPLININALLGNNSPQEDSETKEED